MLEYTKSLINCSFFFQTFLLQSYHPFVASKKESITMVLKSKGTKKQRSKAAPADGYAKWKTDSSDGRLLQSLIENGAISGMPSSQVRENFSTFQKYNPSAFCTTYGRLRKMWSSGSKKVSFSDPTGKYCIELRSLSPYQFS
jgi:hypothetical protein